MKQLKQIQQELDALRKQGKDAVFTEQRKIEKRILFLEMCRLYLETKPREEFIRKSIESLDYIIATLENRFDQWASHRTGGNAELRREYNSLCEIPKFKQQRKTLKFLLD
jgi:hypothetical protein